MSSWIRKLGRQFRRSEMEEDLREELNFHLEEEAELHQADGLSEGQARRAARMDLGNVTVVQEQTRAQWGWRFLDSLRRDLRYSARRIARSPGFTALVIVMLALGVGATTAIYSLFEQVVLRPLPVREPGRLVVLHRDYTAPGRTTSDSSESVFSQSTYLAIRDHDPAFDGVIARRSAGVAVNVGGGTPEDVSGEMVSGNFFDVLGIRPAVGRLLTADDDLTPGAHPVVVLSYGYWVRRFAGDPGILGQTIAVNKHPMTVIGVSEPGFEGILPGAVPDLYLPITMWEVARPDWENPLNNPRFNFLNVVARLKDGYSVEQAQAATDVAYRAAMEINAASTGPGRDMSYLSGDNLEEYLNHRVRLLPAGQGIGSYLRDSWEEPLVLILAMAGFVLLIACANITSLMLGRAAGRQQETAVRFALGASRKTVIRHLLVEGLLIALGAGLLAVGVAYEGVKGLLWMLPDGSSNPWVTAEINWQLLGVAMLLSCLCGIVFGLIPGFQNTRVKLQDALKSQSRASTSGRGRIQTKWMVGVQLAASLILIAATALFGASLYRLMHADLGFDADGLLTFKVNASTARPEAGDQKAYFRELERRLLEMGTLSAVGMSDSGLFSGNSNGGNISLEGYTAAEDESMNSRFVTVNAGFFEAVGTRLIAGRLFTDRDAEGTAKVAVVNESFVRRYFRDQNPVGQRFMLGASNHPVFDYEIVGVVADFHDVIREAPRISLYLPYQQHPLPQLMFYLRTSAPPESVAGEIRKVIRDIDSNVPVDDLTPLPAIIAESIYLDRVVAILAAAFGLVATLLAAIGVYGVVAYAAVQRTREIGIRVAMGALPRSVMRLMLREATVPIVLGVAAGLAGSLAMSRWIESRLYGTEAADPLLLTLAIVALILAATLAALVPALRAARIDPVRALKYE